MAGCSILLIMLCWPAFLVIGLAYLAFELAATVVTSPAFPALVISVLLTAWGSVEAARVMWRAYKDPEGPKVEPGSFRRTLVLFLFAFLAFCVAIVLTGVTLLQFFGTR